MSKDDISFEKVLTYTEAIFYDQYGNILSEMSSNSPKPDNQDLWEISYRNTYTYDDQNNWIQSKSRDSYGTIQTAVRNYTYY
jgi:hypothetical protein